MSANKNKINPPRYKIAGLQIRQDGHGSNNNNRLQKEQTEK
jgi:hypothetical protein